MPDNLPTDVAALVRLSAALGRGEPARISRRLGEAASAAPASEVEEAILQSYLFIGFPGALNTLRLWRELRPDVGPRAEGFDPDGWAARGTEACRTVYGSAYDALRTNVSALHPDVDRWMLTEGYGKVIGRPGLSLDRRELCIVALLAVQNAPRQLHSHLRGALHAGSPPQWVEAALEIALREAESAAAPSPAEARDRALDVWARVRSRFEARATPGAIQSGDQ